VEVPALTTRTQISALSLGTALLFVLLAPVNAQNLKIGFVNVPYLIQNAPQTQAVNQRLRNEFAPREAELQTMAEGFQKKYETYQRDASVMGEAERAALESELSEGDRTLQRRQAELQEDFNIRQEQLLGELQTAIGQQVQTYVEANGYDLVVANVVYVSEAIDITADVLAAISKNADD
jgi:outer membrane protein